MAKKAEIEVELQEPIAPTIDTPTEQPTVLPHTLKFNWDDDERLTIETIKMAVDQMIQREYRDAFVAVQGILSLVREVERDPNTGELLYTESGAPVWKKDASGAVREDYNKLDATDLDSAILHMATYSFFAGQWAIDAYMEAVFAKYMADDKQADAFSAIMQGTIQDKTATANRKSRDERYRAFYKAYTHRKIKELLDRMDSLRRSLEFVRKAQQEDRNREWRQMGNR